MVRIRKWINATPRLANSLHIAVPFQQHLCSLGTAASLSTRGKLISMSEIRQSMREPEAGPSTAPTTREPSPNRDSSLRPLRRPASHGRLSKLMLPGRSRSGSSASRVESVVTAFADEGGPSSGRVTPEQRWRSSRGELWVTSS